MVDCMIRDVIRSVVFGQLPGIAVWALEDTVAVAGDSLVLACAGNGLLRPCLPCVSAKVMQRNSQTDKSDWRESIEKYSVRHFHTDKYFSSRSHCIDSRFVH